MKKEKIISFLVENKFNLQSEREDVQYYNRTITIKTHDQLININGVNSVIPGKIGNIDININVLPDAEMFSNEQESDKMHNIYCCAKFQGFEFRHDHFLTDSEDDVILNICSFLNIFGFKF